MPVNNTAQRGGHARDESVYLNYLPPDQRLSEPSKQQRLPQAGSRVANALASSRRGPPASSAGPNRLSPPRPQQQQQGPQMGFRPIDPNQSSPTRIKYNDAPPTNLSASYPPQQRQPAGQRNSPYHSPPRNSASMINPPQPRVNQMRPLQLRAYPQQQQQPPLQMPQPVILSSQRQNPKIPMLQVTVPPPGVFNSPTPKHMPRQPTSPLAYQHAPPSPRAVFAQPPPSPSAFSSSSETLVASPGAKDGSGKEMSGWRPAQPARAALHLKVPNADDLTADPENDRLMPATPRAGGRQEFWKRFSTVVHDKERKEEIAQKMHSKKRGGARIKSEWLEKQVSGQRNFRLWVGLLALLIIAAIGGGLAYHFVTKDSGSDSDTQPTTNDFGLGTDESSTASDVTSETSTTAMPSASKVSAGQTFRVRAYDEYALLTSIPAAQPSGAESRERRHNHSNHVRLSRNLRKTGRQPTAEQLD